MRKSELIITGGLFGVFSFLFLIGFNISIEMIITFAALFIFTLIASIEIVNYYAYQLFGIGKWIHPILKLSIILIKLDGVERVSETKRIVKYLNNEFEPETARVKLIYYKKQFKKNQNVGDIFEHINYKSSTTDKVRILQHLVKIALSDRLLSDEEEKFIKMVAQKMRIPYFTLKAILALHTYVTEEDIRNPKPNRVFVASSIQKSYLILGLEPTATQKEVKDAYRELAKVYHPDKQRGSKASKNIARAQFQVIARAYELIKNGINK